MRLSWVVLLLLNCVVFLQFDPLNLNIKTTNANVGVVTFMASAKYLEDVRRSSTDHYNDITERYWVIRDDTVKYDQLAVEVPIIEDRVDTVFYWENLSDTIADTLLCIMNNEGSYEFVYNYCCNGFNILDQKTGRFTNTSVMFQLVSESYDQYLGRIDEVGRLIEVSDSVIVPITCRSAMSPNVYTISIEKISEELNLKNDRNKLMCYYNGLNYQDSLKYIYDYEYVMIDKKIEVKFIPLNNEVLQVSFNPETSNFEIRAYYK